jgi:hypothetical protein
MYFVRWRLEILPRILLLTRIGINDIENSFYAMLDRQVLHC